MGALNSMEFDEVKPVSKAVKKSATPLKTTEDLRKFLLDSMTSVTAGKMTTYEAKAISNLSQQVYNTLRAEIDAANFTLRAKDKDVRLAPVTLLR